MYHYNISSTHTLDRKLSKRGGRESIISLNGCGRAGKTTQAQLLCEAKIGVHAPLWTVRDKFDRDVYAFLGHDPERRALEILGAAGMAWIGFEYHWRIKPLLLEGYTVILDHYLADYYVESLVDCPDISVLESFVRHARLPRFEHGFHFYIDINYDTYRDRADRKDLIGGGPLTHEIEVPEHIFNDRRNQYQKLVNSGHLIKIDGMQSKEDVHNEIVGRLNG